MSLELKPTTEKFSLRTIAIVEAAKGGVALIAASGFAMHKETARLFNRLSTHLHLDPASGHPNAIWQAIQTHASAHVKLIAIGALAYAVIRIAEAIGLWYDKRWASWFGVISAAMYVPFEVVNVWRRGTWLSVAFLTITVCAVLFLAHHLRLRIAARDAARR
jgi:uncharacterized membrane protein (DUF2068 family)